jgi:hypothetical protein
MKDSGAEEDDEEEESAGITSAPDEAGWMMTGW